MHLAIAQNNLLPTPRHRANRAGKPAGFAVNETTYSATLNFKRHMSLLPQLNYSALLRLLVATVGYIHRPRQRQSQITPRPGSTATARSRSYNDPQTTTAHRNLAVRSVLKTPTIPCYDDTPHIYDALCYLRRRTYILKVKSSQKHLNEMSLYRGYFVPGGMDPSGTECGSIEITQHVLSSELALPPPPAGAPFNNQARDRVREGINSQLEDPFEETFDCTEGVCCVDFVNTFRDQFEFDVVYSSNWIPMPITIKIVVEEVTRIAGGHCIPCGPCEEPLFMVFAPVGHMLPPVRVHEDNVAAPFPMA